MQTLGNQSPVNWNRLWIAIECDWIWLLLRQLGQKFNSFWMRMPVPSRTYFEYSNNLSYRKTACQESQSPDDEINKFWALFFSSFFLHDPWKSRGQSNQFTRPSKTIIFLGLGVLLCKHLRNNTMTLRPKKARVRSSTQNITHIMYVTSLPRGVLQKP